MSIYHNIINDRFYTLKVIEAMPTMTEATPYLANGQVKKYPTNSPEASDYVRFSDEAMAAYKAFSEKE